MLEQVFRDGPPVNNTTLSGDRQVGKLSDECLQFIMLKLVQRWKISQIAVVLGITNQSVRKVVIAAFWLMMWADKNDVPVVGEIGDYFS